MSKIRKILCAAISAVLISSLCACGITIKPDDKTDAGTSQTEAPQVTMSAFEEFMKELRERGYEGTDEDIIGALNGKDTAITETQAVALAMKSCVTLHVFFRTQEENDILSQVTSVASVGSGVILSLDRETGDAFIVTNYHMIFDERSKEEGHLATKCEIFTYGREYPDYAIPAEYVGGSATFDIAVLKVTGSEILLDTDARACDFTDSDRVVIGERIFAIGNSENEGLAVSSGIVGLDSEDVTLPSADGSESVQSRLIRIDAPVNHGNSGGGIFNSRGELLGICVAKNNKSEVDGIGYMIPSNIAGYAAFNIIDSARNDNYPGILKCMLGITVYGENFRTEPREDGTTKIICDVVIESVAKTSPFIGLLEKGDIVRVLSVRDFTVHAERVHTIVDVMLRARVGDPVRLTVLRNGAEIGFESVLTDNSVTPIR